MCVLALARTTRKKKSVLRRKRRWKLYKDYENFNGGKSMYEEPKINVLFFSVTDIICSSNSEDKWSDENVDGDEGWT